jgi:hypothetical protein
MVRLALPLGESPSPFLAFFARATLESRQALAIPRGKMQQSHRLSARAGGSIEHSKLSTPGGNEARRRNKPHSFSLLPFFLSFLNPPLSFSLSRTNSIKKNRSATTRRATSSASSWPSPSSSRPRPAAAARAPPPRRRPLPPPRRRRRRRPLAPRKPSRSLGASRTPRARACPWPPGTP